jgi:hypothetical protein
LLYGIYLTKSLVEMFQVCTFLNKLHDLTLKK